MNESKNQPLKFDFTKKEGLIKAEETLAEMAVSQAIPVANLVGAQRAVNGRIRLEELQLRYLHLIKPNKGADWTPPSMPLLEN